MTQDRDLEALMASVSPAQAVKAVIAASAVLPPDARRRFLVCFCRGLLDGGLGHLVMLLDGEL